MADAQVEAFRRHFAGGGVPERAAGAKAYLKSDLHFYGVTVPFIRQAAREFRRRHRDLGRAELLALVEGLWQTPDHELHDLAVMLLHLYASRLLPADMAVVEGLLRRAHTWDLVDGLSMWVAGALAAAHPGAREVLRRWAVDDSFWLRRASLLALLVPLRDGGGDFGLFAELAGPMVGEKEFFIRKAIGWVLREVSKRRPELTHDFLSAHMEQVSGLTLREGAKYLPAAQRDELLGRHVARGRR